MLSHASTILASSTAPILAHLSRLAERHGKDRIVFALSANSPDLSVLVSHLTALSQYHVGCLSSPAPWLAKNSAGLISCSVAAFDTSETVSFRSTVPGRPAPQVGRSRALRADADHPVSPLFDAQKDSTEQVDWEAIWNRNTDEHTLPEGLEGLKHGDLSSLLYFSDSAPEGLSNSLSIFPHATKLGLIVPSTPFITGRSVTLFHDGQIHSSGAVGIGIIDPPNPTATVEFAGMMQLTPPLILTKREGNLVMEIDDTNPTRLLLAAMRKHGIDNMAFFLEKDFYLGSLENGKLTRVYGILSGDPARGTMALKSESAPAEGSFVQMLYQCRKSPPDAFPQFEKLCGTKPSITFMASDASDSLVGHTREDNVSYASHTFFACSENGFMLSRPGVGGEYPWRCTAVGGTASLQWLL